MRKEIHADDVEMEMAEERCRHRSDETSPAVPQPADKTTQPPSETDLHEPL